MDVIEGERELERGIMGVSERERMEKSEGEWEIVGERERMGDSW